MELRGKIALITGASSGIGRETALACAREGSSVVTNYKSNVAAARAVLEECNRYSKRNMMVKADISKETAVRDMLRAVKRRYGHLDILINNAGTFDERDAYDNLDAFTNIYRNNFLGAVTVTKYAVPLLRNARHGKIVNVSSIHGRLGQGRPSAIAYAAMKAALENYTMNLAKKLAPNILVNAIAPGRVATPMWGILHRRNKNHLGDAHLIRRMIEPREVADGILFLLKNDAMCGDVLTIDGGYNLMSKE